MQGSETRVWFIQRKLSESMAPRHLIWINISHTISMTSIKAQFKGIVTQLFRKSTVDYLDLKVNCGQNKVKTPDYFVKILILKYHSPFDQELIMVHQGKNKNQQIKKILN